MQKKDWVCSKEDILTGMAVMILLMTTMIEWSMSSWLILVAITLILYGWYVRSK
jgi:hypothetical protein